MAQVTDEQIIAALLTQGTVKKAAAAVKLSERAIYDRMSTGEFKELYQEAKADIIRAAVFSINGKLQQAVETIADVMNNEDNNPATRLQAAQTILNSACKLAARLSTDEQQAAIQRSNNKWGVDIW